MVYVYKDGTDDVVRDISDERHKRQQEIIMHLVPVVSGVMPPDAILGLNFTWGECFKQMMKVLADTPAPRASPHDLPPLVTPV